MEEKFSNWLVREEGKLEATGRNYSRAINRLSEHYTSHTGNPTDIYAVDLEHLVKIKKDYEPTGRFSEKGYETHGLYRAAIKAFYRYRLSNPVTPSVTNVDISPKPSPGRKKAEEKSLAQRIVKFLTDFFRRKESPEVPAGQLVGTRKQLSIHLLPFLNVWEQEVHQKYLADNPKCQRCKSMEFPEVVERDPTDTEQFLKTALQDLSKKIKQAVLISDLENKFKSQLTCGDRLLVLCRTCRRKEDKRKVERFRHEMPPIMRKGPSELKY